MGKIRIKTLGDEAVEQAEKEEAREKHEQKDLRQGKKTHLAGMQGGQRTATVGVSEEEILKSLENKDTAPTEEAKTKTPEEKKLAPAKASTRRIKKTHSRRHLENKKMVSKTSTSLSQALDSLRKFKKTSFDETVELHINTSEKGISGTVSLPHGTGKEIRAKIADDALISQVEKGKIDFDVLVAAPFMMPKLAKVAKILGPKGLMPNPKNGTITDKPEDAIEKLAKGQISFKTEGEAPIIHLSVGKLSFEDKALTENISTVLSAIGQARISSVTLKSTMSPAIKLSI